MSKDLDYKSSRLSAIAQTLGLPIDQLFLGGDKIDGLFDVHECIRLYLAIQTEDGRRRAIDFLRQIVDDEQP
ncbi:hypothetical protein [Methylobacterium platani]|uniref:hypothetical protein n=1 Tax=Methylobacterium platani TaxID=427683 RepID=UPI000B056833|nr:hypothetical protein [Methylobacterium platani]